MTTFSCLFDRYRYLRLPLGIAPTGDKFQRKIDKIFHGLTNVFGIANDILIAGFDDLGRDHDEVVDKVIEIFRNASLKFNKVNCHFMCTSSLFFGKVLSQDGSGPDPRRH